MWKKGSQNMSLWRRNIPVKCKCVSHDRSPQYIQVVLGGEPQWPKTLKSLLPFHIVLARREKPISQWINGVILRSWTWLYSWSSAIDKGGTNTLTREQERLCTAKTFIKLFYVHVFYLVNSLETSSDDCKLHRVVQFVWMHAYPYFGALLINYTVLLKTPINI